MFKIFNKPHPFIFNTYSIVIPGMAAFLIILLLAPFQFQEIEILQRSLYALLIALFVSASIFFTVKLLQKLFPAFMKEDNWTIGREVLLFLMVIFLIVLGIFASIFFTYTGNESIVQLFLKTTFFTVCISFFPIVILVLFEQYRQQKIQFNRAQKLTETLKAENEKLQSETIQYAISANQIQLKAENGKVALQLFPSEIICLQSDGNYVDVFYEVDKVVTKKLIRNRLKNLEETLTTSNFFRCHHRFMVNGNYITKVEGNARNLELTLRGIEFKIPVSRAKVKDVSSFLQTLKKSS
ncbi:LytTR family transcriptional regulator [Kordia sp. YSTF-M3]|uniref:LytTR family transcriptional regulator n=1 Tax=Kordia aestuariivivens TaxID=2759037 RepID=A0ABR7Q9Y8_9FLAO|nr:LytTR family transcriptional regulator DNA-binding domain-containing protein [Kordia aestuariivivens]MBC8755308.1 LytTR family transcriptional regulator [Kordia aestuariivivens]